MQAYESSAKTDLFYYARRFEPLSFKSGKPKKWAADLFDDEMTGRFCELQGYLSISAKQRDSKSQGAGFAGRGLTVEVGSLWTPVITGIYMDTVGKLENAGYPLVAGPDGDITRTYTIATHLGRESVIRPGKKPAIYPEMEVYMISDSEDFCQDVKEILEAELPNYILREKPKRIDIRLCDGNEFEITYIDGPMMGEKLGLTVRFG